MSARVQLLESCRLLITDLAHACLVTQPLYLALYVTLNRVTSAMTLRMTPEVLGLAFKPTYIPM